MSLFLLHFLSNKRSVGKHEDILKNPILIWPQNFEQQCKIINYKSVI